MLLRCESWTAAIALTFTPSGRTCGLEGTQNGSRRAPRSPFLSISRPDTENGPRRSPRQRFGPFLNHQGKWPQEASQASFWILSELGTGNCPRRFPGFLIISRPRRDNGPRKHPRPRFGPFLSLAQEIASGCFPGINFCRFLGLGEKM